MSYIMVGNQRDHPVEFKVCTFQLKYRPERFLNTQSNSLQACPNQMQTFFSTVQNARVLLKKRSGFGLTQQTGTTPHTPRHSLWQTRINCRQHLRDSFHPLSEWKWDNESGPTDSVITGCGDPTTTSSFERERGG